VRDASSPNRSRPSWKKRKIHEEDKTHSCRKKSPVHTSLESNVAVIQTHLREIKHLTQPVGETPAVKEARKTLELVREVTRSIPSTKSTSSR